MGHLCWPFVKQCEDQQRLKIVAQVESGGKKFHNGTYLKMTSVSWFAIKAVRERPERSVLLTTAP